MKGTYTVVPVAELDDQVPLEVAQAWNFQIWDITTKQMTLHRPTWRQAAVLLEPKYGLPRELEVDDIQYWMLELPITNAIRDDVEALQDGAAADFKMLPNKDAIKLLDGDENVI